MVNVLVRVSLANNSCCVVNIKMWCLKQSLRLNNSRLKRSTIPSTLQHVRNYKCSWLYIAASLRWTAYYFIFSCSLASSLIRSESLTWDYKKHWWWDSRDCCGLLTHKLQNKTSWSWAGANCMRKFFLPVLHGGGFWCLMQYQGCAVAEKLHKVWKKNFGHRFSHQQKPSLITERLWSACEWHQNLYSCITCKRVPDSPPP